MLTSLLEGQLNLSNGVYILLVVLFFLFCIGACVLLFFGIKKDRNRLIAEKYKIRELDRAGLEELLKHKYETAKEDTHFSVMLVQIDGMTDMKMSLGERQVKKITQILRERIVRVIPHGSKICDYDEERLAVYIEEHMDNTGLTNVAMVTISECNKPVTLLTRAKLNINVNLGIASNNEFSADAVSLLQNLELALVTAKKGGFNKFVIYSEELAETQTEEYKQYQEIKTAIAEHQFTLFYQPIFDVNANKAIAYESLVRWEHPTLGVLTPVKFLPIMEQTGDINWIGVWAFEELLRTQTKHYKDHPEDEDLIFTLNLSPKQLMYPHLAEEFRKIYKKFKIPAKNICLEIVEFQMFNNVPEVASNILKLTQMGFKIAIDDFGLEMSSLKTLEDLQFDWVKLDRKFIEQAQDDFLIGGVVETLVGFAERKNFIVVAEGVEDDVILDYIKGLKIGYGQGYFYGKPKPANEYN
ncbi:MAG: GGDEF domain-containing phosphodiesterase, partial [Clostridia bacterium]|nr:GGDEF domain-containing phosphodiesterase [Clostridia bacterium]